MQQEYFTGMALGAASFYEVVIKHSLIKLDVNGLPYMVEDHFLVQGVPSLLHGHSK